MKKLVLLGGGHAHVAVLQSLAAQPLHDTEVTLVSPYPRQVYSGMLPGWVAGHYALEACMIPLAPLAEAAGVRFLLGAATAIDPAQGEITFVSGGTASQRLGYDMLSIDTGSVASAQSIPGSEHALAVRPIEDFITRLSTARTQIDAKLSAGGKAAIAVVGAGAAGVELALSLAHAYRTAIESGDMAIHLISAANTLPGGSGTRVRYWLARRKVRLIENAIAECFDADGVLLRVGGAATHLKTDLTICATGSAAARWPAASGLACDEQGYIAINAHLQSVSHTNIFASGDCASMAAHPRPKSGVYAVRAGPPLAANLRRTIRGETLLPYRPQARSLYLISTGAPHAIASWGALSWSGAWVWRWKDRIDRAFVARYRPD